MMPNIDVKHEHWQIIKAILQKNVPHYEVWAFGSRTKGRAKPYSDLDLAIITDHPMSITLHANLSNDFSESDLPWKVDIVDWATTSETFKNIIKQHYVVVKQSMLSENTGLQNLSGK